MGSGLKSNKLVYILWCNDIDILVVTLANSSKLGHKQVDTRSVKEDIMETAALATDLITRYHIKLESLQYCMQSAILTKPVFLYGIRKTKIRNTYLDHQVISTQPTHQVKLIWNRRFNNDNECRLPIILSKVNSKAFFYNQFLYFFQMFFNL